jgi:hypothetical protein
MASRLSQPPTSGDMDHVSACPTLFSGAMRNPEERPEDAADKEDAAMPEIIACPDPTCQAPARIVDRWTFVSTSGPVEHVKTTCEQGHWFTPMADSLHLHAEQAERLRAAV